MHCLFQLQTISFHFDIWKGGITVHCFATFHNFKNEHGSSVPDKGRTNNADTSSGAAPLGLGRWVLFACPVCWSLLIGHHYTPHYPIRAWLEGETDHAGGWYAFVSLNYTTLGPWLILVQSITANVSNGTDAHAEITTNIVQLTFSQGCLWPVKEAQVGQAHMIALIHCWLCYTLLC